jgi:hypothetical protein
LIQNRTEPKMPSPKSTKTNERKPSFWNISYLDRKKMHKSRWPYLEKKKQQHKVVALSPNQQCTNNKQSKHKEL